MATAVGFSFSSLLLLCLATAVIFVQEGESREAAVDTRAQAAAARPLTRYLRPGAIPNGALSRLNTVSRGFGGRVRVCLALSGFSLSTWLGYLWMVRRLQLSAEKTHNRQEGARKPWEERTRGFLCICCCCLFRRLSRCVSFCSFAFVLLSLDALFSAFYTLFSGREGERETERRLCSTFLLPLDMICAPFDVQPPLLTSALHTIISLPCRLCYSAARVYIPRYSCVFKLARLGMVVLVGHVHDLSPVNAKRKKYRDIG